MSNAVTWLLGLLGLAVLSFVCVSHHAPAIETDIATRATAALAGDMPAATVGVDGRDVILTGTVATTALKDQAGDTVRRLEGVRTVQNDLVVEGGQAAPMAVGSGEGFGLTEVGGVLVARGVVGTEETRDAFLDRARAAYPGRVIRDEMTVVDGASADWDPSVSGLLPIIGRISMPALAVEGDEVVVRGTVESQAVKAEIEAQARAAVQAPYTLRSELRVDGEPSSGDDQVASSGSSDTDVQGAEAAMREALSIGPVQFASGTARLTDGSRQILDRVADVMARFPTIAAQVQGHTDSQGDETENQALSQQRAEAVETYLIGKGVDGDALTLRGFGEAEPIDSNDTVEGRARNRRVVFALSRR